MGDADYYQLLGVEKDSDEATIKKAYRKLALKWHPDKNPDNKEEAERRFKNISEAYDVLCDAEKRRIYDRYGKEGLTGPAPGGGQGGGGQHGFSFNFGGGRGGGFHFRSADEIFREFFEHDPFGDDILADFFGGGFGRTNRAHRSQNNVSRRMDPFGMMGGFGGFGGMGGFGGGGHSSAFSDSFFNGGGAGGFSSSTSFSTGGGGGGSFKSSSTSTKIVNGKKIVTKKVVENGTETVEVYENNVLTKRSVDGVPQLAGADNPPSRKIQSSKSKR